MGLKLVWTYLVDFVYKLVYYCVDLLASITLPIGSISGFLSVAKQLLGRFFSVRKQRRSTLYPIEQSHSTVLEKVKNYDAKCEKIADIERRLERQRSKLQIAQESLESARASLDDSRAKQVEFLKREQGVTSLKERTQELATEIRLLKNDRSELKGLIDIHIDAIKSFEKHEKQAPFPDHDSALGDDHSGARAASKRRSTLNVSSEKQPPKTPGDGPNPWLQCILYAIVISMEIWLFLLAAEALPLLDIEATETVVVIAIVVAFFVLLFTDIGVGEIIKFFRQRTDRQANEQTDQISPRPLTPLSVFFAGLLLLTALAINIAVGVLRSELVSENRGGGIVLGTVETATAPPPWGMQEYFSLGLGTLVFVASVAAAWLTHQGPLGFREEVNRYYEKVKEYNQTRLRDRKDRFRDNFSERKCESAEVASHLIGASKEFASRSRDESRSVSLAKLEHELIKSCRDAKLLDDVRKRLRKDEENYDI